MKKIDTSKTLFDEVNKLQSMHMHDEALLKLEEAEKNGLNTSRLYLMKGLIFLEKNNFEKAMLNFQEAFRKDSKNVIISNNVGLLHKKILNYSAAIEAFKYSIELDPANDFAKYHLSVILREMNKYQEGLELLYSSTGRIKIGQKIEIFKN